MLPVAVSPATLPLYVGKYAATFELPYVAGIPVANATLPKMYPPLTLPVVMMLAVSVPLAR